MTIPEIKKVLVDKLTSGVIEDMDFHPYQEKEFDPSRYVDVFVQTIQPVLMDEGSKLSKEDVLKSLKLLLELFIRLMDGFKDNTKTMMVFSDFLLGTPLNSIFGWAKPDIVDKLETKYHVVVNIHGFGKRAIVYRGKMYGVLDYTIHEPIIKG